MRRRPLPAVWLAVPRRASLLAGVAVSCALAALSACDQRAPEGAPREGVPTPPPAVVGTAGPAPKSVAIATGTTSPGSTTAPSVADLDRIGRLAFFDPGLSASSRQSCASCHSPEHAYGPPNGEAVQFGGPDLKAPGTRAVPSLRYTLPRTPAWNMEYIADPLERVTETDVVPTGGFTWDGRVDTLAQQAAIPLLAANEMANRSPAEVIARLSRAPYAGQFRQVFGRDVFDRPDEAFAHLTAAIERFELDEPSLHPYSSRYDQYLDGKLQLDAHERRGLQLFSDPDSGNCASCHPVQRGADGSHPLLTDYGFEAVGAPRNPEIPANADPAYFDMGLCGPVRVDQRDQKRYCGLFKTPSLRNVAARGAFFHNGVFHDLMDVLRFYVQRDIRPQRWYPRGPHGVVRYDDLPPGLRDNVDVIDAPLNRHPGDAPIWTEADIADVAAFLRTLTDADVQPVAGHPWAPATRPATQSVQRPATRLDAAMMATESMPPGLVAR